MKKQNNVNHDFDYHAEIRFETERGFNFTCATGSSYKEFLEDIDSRMAQYRDRQPKIVKAIKSPNKKSVDITNKILNETNRD
jgi:hypothetical protein